MTPCGLLSCPLTMDTPEAQPALTSISDLTDCPGFTCSPRPPLPPKLPSQGQRVDILFSWPQHLNSLPKMHVITNFPSWFPTSSQCSITGQNPCIPGPWDSSTPLFLTWTPLSHPSQFRSSLSIPLHPPTTVPPEMLFLALHPYTPKSSRPQLKPCTSRVLVSENSSSSLSLSGAQGTPRVFVYSPTYLLPLSLLMPSFHAFKILLYS